MFMELLGLIDLMMNRVRTFGSRNSPGSSTSAVCKLKLLKKRHFSSIKKDLFE